LTLPTQHTKQVRIYVMLCECCLLCLLFWKIHRVNEMYTIITARARCYGMSSVRPSVRLWRSWIVIMQVGILPK